MSGDAEQDGGLYSGLCPEEERTLKGIEEEVTKLMLDNGIIGRPIWTSESKADGRFIQLCVYGSSRILFELAEGEFVGLSGGELVSRLQHSIGWRQ